MLAEDGWRQVYLTLAGIVLALVVRLSLLLRRRPPEEAMAAARRRAQAASMSAGLSPRALQWLLRLAGLGCCMAMSMLQVHIVAYCVDLCYGPAVGVEMLSLMLLGGVVSRIPSGPLADWIGGVKTLLVGTVIMSTVLGMALGGWTSGWIYDLTGSYQAAFLKGVGWSLLNLGVVLTILVRSRPRSGVMAAA